MSARTSKKLETIHADLRDKILTRQWREGDRLPTETELAAHFGCAIGTVSKAIALLAHDGFVKRRTRLGTQVVWSPGKSNVTQLDSFAFIYPSEQHEGIWRTVKGFQDAARERERRVVMLTTGTDYRKEAEYVGRLSEFDVRGAVVYPILQTANDQVHFSQMLMASKFPVVLVEVNIAGLGWPAVVVDGFHAGYTMAKYLIEQGHERVGFLSNYSWVPSMRDRYMGYRWALEEAGLKESSDTVLLEPSMHANFSDSLEEPRRLGRDFLAKAAGRIDAVLCADDFLAQGLILAAQAKSIKVPKDLKVAGINDYGNLASVQPLLTTYRIPCEKVGRSAFEQLEYVLSGQPAAAAEMQVRGELVVRESA